MRRYLPVTSILIALLITLLLSGLSLAQEPERLWFAVFTADGPSTWTEGEHTYHFEWSGTECSSAASSPGATQDFIVARDAPIYDGFVLLRGFYELARVGGSGGERCSQINQIHPDQPTRFHLGWVTDWPMTRREAQACFEGMTLTAVWDGGSATLERHEIRPMVDAPAWLEQVCSWTARP